MGKIHFSMILAFSLALAACNFYGGVKQGRCVAYDAAKKTVTMVIDTTLDQHDPHYSGEVDTFTLPDNPLDMGPAPTAGGLLMIEPEQNKILYYDPDSRSIKEMAVEFVKVEKGIRSDDKRVKPPKDGAAPYPKVDKEQGTVTVYSPRLEEIVTFKVPQKELDLPMYTWEQGNEVRIAYRKDKPGMAIRFMNVSKTSIFTR